MDSWQTVDHHLDKHLSNSSLSFFSQLQLEMTLKYRKRRRLCTKSLLAKLGTNRLFFGKIGNKGLLAKLGTKRVLGSKRCQRRLQSTPTRDGSECNAVQMSWPNGGPRTRNHIIPKPEGVRVFECYLLQLEMTVKYCKRRRLLTKSVSHYPQFAPIQDGPEQNAGQMPDVQNGGLKTYFTLYYTVYHIISKWGRILCWNAMMIHQTVPCTISYQMMAPKQDRIHCWNAMIPSTVPYHTK